MDPIDDKVGLIRRPLAFVCFCHINSWGKAASKMSNEKYVRKFLSFVTVISSFFAESHLRSLCRVCTLWRTYVRRPTLPITCAKERKTENPRQ